MIRPKLRDAFWRGRELLAAGAVALLGLWIAAQGGYLLVPIGGLVLAAALGMGVLAWRRLRFAARGDAPGIVRVDEGQISYFGPEVGGFVSLPDLVEIRLIRMRGRRLWRLKQADGQAVLVPLDAAGAEALFDAFGSLPGLTSRALVGALQEDAAGPAVVTEIAENRVIWRREGRGLVRA